MIIKVESQFSNSKFKKRKRNLMKQMIILTNFSQTVLLLPKRKGNLRKMIKACLKSDKAKSRIKEQ